MMSSAEGAAGFLHSLDRGFACARRFGGRRLSHEEGCREEDGVGEAMTLRLEGAVMS